MLFCVLVELAFGLIRGCSWRCKALGRSFNVGSFRVRGVVVVVVVDVVSSRSSSRSSSRRAVVLEVVQEVVEGTNNNIGSSSSGRAPARAAALAALCFERGLRGLHFSRTG